MLTTTLLLAQLVNLRLMVAIAKTKFSSAGSTCLCYFVCPATIYRASPPPKKTCILNIEKRKQNKRFGANFSLAQCLFYSQILVQYGTCIIDYEERNGSLIFFF